MHEDLFPTFRDEVPKSRVAETYQGLSLLLSKRIVTDQTVDLRFPVSGYEAMITKHTTNHSVADSDVVFDLGWVMRQEGLRYLLFVTTPAFAQQGHEHNRLVNVGHFQLVLYEIGEFLVTANLVRHPHSSLATSRNLLVFLVFAPYITNSIRS